MDLSALASVPDFERAARARASRAVWAYVAGGAGTERSVHANAAAFDELWLRPRVPNEAVAVPATCITLCGKRLSMPLLLGPTSPQRLLHEQAEIATARAAAACGTLSIVSTDSHYPFPAIAAAGDCWFQLYPYRCAADVDATIDMAIAAGAGALVVTVDACYPGRRLSARRAGFRTPPDVDFGTLRMLGVLTGPIPAEARLPRLPLTWTDLSRIRARAKIPLWIKGILDPTDARRCLDFGADGIIVSNHGGRQLDAVMPSLVALRDVVREVGTRCPILVDGGIRSGVDVIKAIACGACGVCIGRPYLWGLLLGGEAGVLAVLSLFRREIEDTLQQLGLASVANVTPDCLVDTGRTGGEAGRLRRRQAARWARPARADHDRTSRITNAVEPGVSP